MAEATNEQNAGAEDLCDEAAISCNASVANMVPTPMSPMPMVCEDLRQPDEGPEESQRMSRRKFSRRQHDVIHSLVGNLK